MKRVITLLILLLSSMYVNAQMQITIDEYFDKNAQVMLLIDPSNGKIVKANKSAAKFYAYTQSQLEQFTIQDINTFTKEQVQKEMQDAKKENRNYFIFRHRTGNGEIKRVEVYSYPIVYNNRKVLYSTIQDVSNLELAQKEIEHYSKTLEQQVDIKSKELLKEESNLKNLFLFGFIVQLLIIVYLYRTIQERKKVEDKLESTLHQIKRSEETMKDIINSFPIPIIRAKSNFEDVDFCNKAFSSLFGWQLQDVDTIQKWELKAYPNENYRDKIFKKWFKLVEETNNKKLKTSERSIMVEVTCKNGDVKLCQLWYHNNHGDIYGIFYDMTDQIALEKENLEQQKMILTQAKIAAVGEMLGNIAHQWKQPLSIISSNVTGLNLSMDLNPDFDKSMVKETSENVMKQVMYLSHTIDDFKNFFTSDSETLNEFNVKDTMDKLYGLIKDSLENNYIQPHLDMNDVYILNNENRLVQCLLNICNNAKDAMVLNKIPSDDRHIFATIKEENNHAIISIKDSGGGIPEDIKDRIFEPYFTTKHKSIGTGVGLYMTFQMVTSSFHGTVEANNVEYEHEGKQLKGAEFTIKIPLNIETT